MDNTRPAVPRVYSKYHGKMIDVFPDFMQEWDILMLLPKNSSQSEKSSVQMLHNIAHTELKDEISWHRSYARLILRLFRVARIAPNESPIPPLKTVAQQEMDTAEHIRALPHATRAVAAYGIFLSSLICKWAVQTYRLMQAAHTDTPEETTFADLARSRGELTTFLTLLYPENQTPLPHQLPYTIDAADVAALYRAEKPPKIEAAYLARRIGQDESILIVEAAQKFLTRSKYDTFEPLTKDLERRLGNSEHHKWFYEKDRQDQGQKMKQKEQKEHFWELLLSAFSRNVVPKAFKQSSSTDTNINFVDAFNSFCSDVCRPIRNPFDLKTSLIDHQSSNLARDVLTSLKDSEENRHWAHEVELFDLITATQVFIYNLKLIEMHHNYKPGKAALDRQEVDKLMKDRDHWMSIRIKLGFCDRTAHGRMKDWSKEVFFKFFVQDDSAQSQTQEGGNGSSSGTKKKPPKFGNIFAGKSSVDNGADAE